MNNIEFVPILFNSFIQRKHFIDVALHFYKKYFPKNQIYLTIDDESYQSADISILTYEGVEKTSSEMHLDSSRFYRHYYTLNYLKNNGSTYVMNCMDDGWIGNVIGDDLNRCVYYLEKYKADRIDLCGPQPEYEIKHVEGNLHVVNPNNTLPWYLTNQCAIWRVDSLLAIYEKLGPVSDCDLEKYGSQLARDLKYKFLTFNTSILDNNGVFQRNVGLSEKGVNLLKKYCEEEDIDFYKQIKKFS